MLICVRISMYDGDNAPMSKSEPSSRLSTDGLRYSAETPGSPFLGLATHVRAFSVEHIGRVRQ
jgi:hypothetical protein